MPDNVLTSVDNKRILAAKMGGSDVQAIPHEFDAILPGEIAFRFPGPKGQVPTTWGDAILNRIARQGLGWRQENPYGSFQDPAMTWPRE